MRESERERDRDRDRERERDREIRQKENIPSKAAQLRYGADTTFYLILLILSPYFIVYYSFPLSKGDVRTFAIMVGEVMSGNEWIYGGSRGGDTDSTFKQF